jgi:hypothetical protein
MEGSRGASKAEEAMLELWLAATAQRHGGEKPTTALVGCWQQHLQPLELPRNSEYFSTT